MQLNSDAAGNFTTFAYDKAVARKEVILYQLISFSLGEGS